jgi:hypothetical protein
MNDFDKFLSIDIEKTHNNKKINKKEETIENKNKIAELSPLTKIDKNGSIILDNKQLKLHRDLTMHRVLKGNFYNPSTEKINNAIFEFFQSKMKNNFFEIYSMALKNIFSLKDKEINLLLESSYKQNLELSDKILNSIVLDKKLLAKFYKTVDSYNTYYKKNYASTLSDEELEESDTLYSRIYFNKNKLKLNENGLILFNEDKVNKMDIINIIKDLKEYAFKRTIFDSLPSISINFTKLCKSLEIKNISDAKKSYLQLPNLVLEFISLNGKNKSELTSALVSMVEFTYLKKSKTTILKVQIPEAILKKMLIPDKFVSIFLSELQKMNSPYSNRLTTLLRTYVDLTPKITIPRNIFEEFFTIPESSKRNSSILKRKVLEPAISEVNSITDIETSYELYPPKKYNEITFTIKRKKKPKDSKPVEIEIIDDNIIKNHSKIEEFPSVQNAIEKAKRNIYVSKAWSKYPKHTLNKINKILSEKGEVYTINILEELYKGLKSEIQTTLVQYINGIIKNIVMHSKDESEKSKKIFKKNIEKVPEDNSKQMFFNISEEDEIEIFKKLDDFDKLKIEERAIDLCVKRDEVDELFLLNMKSKSESLYFGAIKNYIKIAINEMLNNKEET